MNRETTPEEGNILLINKELGWTSFDVVKKIRNIVRLKKVGHAGTLDPLATGLLIVCTGRKTKQINQFMDLEKEYVGSMIIGKTTPSVDLETEVDSETPIEHITSNDVLETASKFKGEIMQVPPIFSALKKDGEPLYKKARKGESVKLAPRPVVAFNFEILSIEFPEIRFKLVCSKGFYVRSLVRDFGEALGVGAYMSALERTRIGEYGLDKAMTVEEFVKSTQMLDS